MKHRIVFLLILTSGILLFGQSEFSELMNRLLQNSADYQKDYQQLEQDIVESSFNKSLKIADVNLLYQKNINDIVRDEEKTSDSVVYESTSISESDERWQIELTKTFFPLDFDDTKDEISNSLDILDSRVKLLLTIADTQSEIISDFIDWYEAEQMLPVLEDEIAILRNQEQKLSYLHQNNIISPKELIDVIEDLQAAETDYMDFQQNIERFDNLYKLDLEEFLNSMHDYIAMECKPDTTSFIELCTKIETRITKSASKIDKSLSWGKAGSVMPELTTSVSYNWRNIDQDWEINVSDEQELWDREQEEEYPELRLEMSLPLNLVGWYKAKQGILRNYKQELAIKQQSYGASLIALRNRRLRKLNEFYTKLIRQKQLCSLYEEIYHTAEAKMKSEPLIKDDSLINNLRKTEIKYNKSQIRYQSAQMSYYREVYLINSFGDIN